MKKYAILFAVLSLTATTLLAQTSAPSGTFWHPNPRNEIMKKTLKITGIAVLVTGAQRNHSAHLSISGCWVLLENLMDSKTSSPGNENSTQ